MFARGFLVACASVNVQPFLSSSLLVSRLHMVSRGAMAPSGACSSRVSLEDATYWRSYDFETAQHTKPQTSWEKEEAIAAKARVLDALTEVSCGGGDDACGWMLRDVASHLEQSDAKNAVEAYKLIVKLIADNNEESLRSLKTVARHVRDVLVLRLLSEMQPRDRGCRDSFLAALAKAFGQDLETFSQAREPRDILLHAHRKCTKGRDAFLSQTQMDGRRRKRRSSLGRRIKRDVAFFLATVHPRL